MADDPDQPSSADYPELVVGIAGPIGVSMELIADAIARALHDVGYESTAVKLTKEMQRFAIEREDLKAEVAKWSGTDTFVTLTCSP